MEKNNRSDFIEVDKKIRLDPIRVKGDEVVQIVKQYCLEKGKDEKIIDLLLLYSDPLIIKGIMLPEALEYFEQKYEVCLITYNDRIITIF